MKRSSRDSLFDATKLVEFEDSDELSAFNSTNTYQSQLSRIVKSLLDGTWHTKLS